MKIDIVQRLARKKDFWDIHELLDVYTPDQTPLHFPSFDIKMTFAANLSPD
jgi:hypothetical protein